MNEKDSIWRRVIRSKYGDNGLGWHPSKPSGAYGQSCGDSITKDGEDFFIIFPSRLVLVLLFCFGMIVGVRRVLYVTPSPLFMCLR